MKTLQYCEKCEKDTTHEIEEIQSLNNGGGFPHNDDVLMSFECSECGNYYENI